MGKRDDRDLRDGWALLIAAVIAVALICLLVVLNACTVTFISGNHNEVKQQPKADVEATIPERKERQ